MDKKISLVLRSKQARGYSIEKVFAPLSKKNYINLCYISSYKLDLYELILLFIKGLTLKDKFIHITGDVHYIAFLWFWKKSILTIHDLNYYEKSKRIKRFLIGVIWFRLPLLCADKIVAISPATYSALIRLFPGCVGKLVMIPNGFEEFDGDRVLTEKSGGIFRVLCVGTALNKNLERLFQAINKIEGIQLIIVGNLTQLQRSLLISNNIEYINYFELSEKKIKDLYLSSDMLYYASTAEGFGLPILEAQSLGLPVLTSNISSLPYVAGNAAYFVDPYSINDIYNAIVQFRMNKGMCFDLASKGLINIQRFSNKIFVEEYEELYKATFGYDFSRIS